jgi:hypothetical protein
MQGTSFDGAHKYAHIDGFLLPKFMIYRVEGVLVCGPSFENADLEFKRFLV